MVGLTLKKDELNRANALENSVVAQWGQMVFAHALHFVLDGRFLSRLATKFNSVPNRTGKGHLTPLSHYRKF